MEDNCPQFLAPNPLVIPMNHETEVTFQGKNLETVKVSSLYVGSDLLKFEETVTMHESDTFSFRTPKLSHDANETLPLHLYVKSFGKNIDSKLQVTLYNCSFGRSDCSLCLAADPAYRCVWCRGQNRCVYEALCSNVTSECPPPVITRVSLSQFDQYPHPPTCSSSQAIHKLGSADYRSSLRQAHWVGASSSRSMAPTWVSKQMMSRRSLWLARTVPLNQEGTLYLPGLCAQLRLRRRPSQEALRWMLMESSAIHRHMSSSRINNPSLSVWSHDKGHRQVVPH